MTTSRTLLELCDVEPSDMTLEELASTWTVQSHIQRDWYMVWTDNPTQETEQNTRLACYSVRECSVSPRVLPKRILPDLTTFSRSWKFLRKVTVAERKVIEKDRLAANVIRGFPD